MRARRDYCAEYERRQGADIKMNFEPEDDRFMSRPEIGKALGITQQRVYQIELAALRKLRQIGRGADV